MKKSPYVISLLQALGLSVYVLLVALFMQNAIRWLGYRTPGTIMAVIMMMLFVTSALICGSLVLGYPITLALKGEGKMAIKMVGLTIGWLIIGLIAVIILAQFFKQPMMLV